MGRNVAEVSILVVIVQRFGAQCFGFVLVDRGRSIAVIGCVNPRCSCVNVRRQVSSAEWTMLPMQRPKTGKFRRFPLIQV